MSLRSEGAVVLESIRGRVQVARPTNSEFDEQFGAWRGS